MSIVRQFLFHLTMISLSATLLCAQSGQSMQSDAQAMDLRGAVASMEELRAGYREANGEWIRQYLTPTQTIQFNRAGYKTEERFPGHRVRRNTYSYDERGRLIAREQYSSGMLTLSWERVFDGKASTIRELRYDSSGELSGKTVQHFNAAGDKLSELRYNANDVVVQRWEHEPTSNGSRISYTPRWGSSEVTWFDEKGRISEMRSRSGDSRRSWRLSYDEQGRLIEAIYADNQPQLTDVYTFRYGAAGRLVRIDHDRQSGQPVSRRRYAYVSAETLKTETLVCFDDEGAPDHLWSYSYDEAGRVSEKEYENLSRPFSCRWVYGYDGEGRKTLEIFYDSQDRIFTRNESRYDARGNKIEEHSCGRGFAQDSRTIYEYDAAGRLIDTVGLDSGGQQLSRQSSRYNEQGDIVETASFNADGSLSSATRYEYSYDEQGNWIQRITLLTHNAKESYDVPTEFLKRTITYHR